mmetsp:Transcript_10059/g.27087  ORF Transcript_10059/g.27087 Transcript_10059/m.27087 type:complete len:209 (-) Transcript_10059:198-824(-)
MSARSPLLLATEMASLMADLGVDASLPPPPPPLPPLASSPNKTPTEPSVAAVSNIAAILLRTSSKFSTSRGGRPLRTSSRPPLPAASSRVARSRARTSSRGRPGPPPAVASSVSTAVPAVASPAAAVAIRRSSTSSSVSVFAPLSSLSMLLWILSKRSSEPSSGQGGQSSLPPSPPLGGPRRPTGGMQGRFAWRLQALDEEAREAGGS